MKIQQFVPKTFTIDAVRLTDDNFDEVTKWCGGEPVYPFETGEEGRSYIKVDVKRPLGERQTRAFVGDWVLKAKGGFKVYTNVAFRRGYDLKSSGSNVTVVNHYFDNTTTNVATAPVAEHVPDAAADSPRVLVDSPEENASPRTQV